MWNFVLGGELCMSLVDILLIERIVLQRDQKGKGGKG